MQRRFLFLFFVIGLAAGVGQSGIESAVAGIFSPHKPAPSKADNSVVTPAAALSFDKKLIGLDGGQVKALLGAPELIRRENGAEVWQYVKGDCALNIFLFEKPPVAGVRVQYVDAFGTTLPKRGAPVVATGRERCLTLFSGGGAVSLPSGGAPRK